MARSRNQNLADKLIPSPVTDTEWVLRCERCATCWEAPHVAAVGEPAVCPTCGNRAVIDDVHLVPKPNAGHVRTSPRVEDR